MSKHTKGPWHCGDKPIFGWWHIYSNNTVDGNPCISGRQAIATIPAASKKNDPECAAMFAANARLATAAPELLSALESAWQWMEGQADAQSKGGHATFDLMMLREQRDIARAAIDKATGES